MLVTDLYRPPALEVCDWPVEQLLAEETWSAHRSGNWLTQAAEHLRAAQQTYGASYIIAPTGSWVSRRSAAPPGVCVQRPHRSAGPGAGDLHSGSRRQCRCG